MLATVSRPQWTQRTEWVYLGVAALDRLGTEESSSPLTKWLSGPNKALVSYTNFHLSKFPSQISPKNSGSINAKELKEQKN